MKRVLVFGATGMLGSALVEVLSRQGFEVIGAARAGADISIDVSQSSLLYTVLKEVTPQVIVNAAASVSLEDCERSAEIAWGTNARPVAVMARYTAQSGCKLIQLSTDHYYTGDGCRRHREDEAICLVNDYARSKYAAEAFALTDQRSLVLRTNVAGFRPQGRPTFAQWLFESLEQGKPISLFDDFFTSTIDTRSFSRCVADLIRRDCRGLYNLASCDVASKKQFAAAVAHHNGWKLEQTMTGSVHTLVVPRAESLGLDVSRITHCLGYKMPTLKEVVKMLSEEYRNEL